MSASSPLLRIEHVYKAYADHLVLQNVDLTVDAHEVICLIGRSGCGKSTLLRCINLLEEIQSGRILLEDREITSSKIDADRVRQEIGMVFQSFNLFPHRTVLENITMAPIHVQKVPKRQAREEALELLNRIGLPDRANEYPDRLSGGQQQRVAIARALALKPKLILLDEVTSSLDPETIGGVMQLIRELRGAGMTMMMATHQMGFAREIADRIAFLDAGRIVEIGPPSQIFDNPREDRTREFVSHALSAAADELEIIAPVTADRDSLRLTNPHLSALEEVE
ncbi:MAG: amino acid ABC transporter ATP-binding protein [Thermomicrobiales bacterium]